MHSVLQWQVTETISSTISLFGVQLLQAITVNYSIDSTQPNLHHCLAAARNLPSAQHRWLHRKLASNHWWRQTAITGGGRLQSPLMSAMTCFTLLTEWEELDFPIIYGSISTPTARCEIRYEWICEPER